MSNNIQKLRLEKGLSQSQLAELSGISVRTLQSYEQGDRDICKAAVETAFKIAKALDVSIEQLFK